MKVFYNDIDKFCCGVLRKNIATGSLYAGDVSDKDIREIHGRDLAEYKQIHLFAGIGGFPLGFRWAGMPDDFSILTGGFPCQPFSHAGRRKGSADNRYLWPEMLRVISEVTPIYVLAENVRGFISLESGRYLDTVYADLEREGYEVLPPFVLPACGFGAPHRRDRCWILAYRGYDGRSAQQQFKQEERPEISDSSCEGDVADSFGQSVRDGRSECLSETPGEMQSGEKEWERIRANIGDGCSNVSNSTSPRLHARTLAGIHSGETGARSRNEESERLCTFSGHVCDTASAGFPDGTNQAVYESRPQQEPKRSDWWEIEPTMGRVVDGVSGRVDSLKSLGNAIVPQIAAYLGSRVLEFDRLVSGTLNEPQRT